MKHISLFSHNEKAYEALCEGINKYPLAFIEHATGTGKSFILLKYLYEKMKNKRILFVSLHDEMFDQLFNNQMRTLGISRNEFLKFDTMIYHNIPKYNMQDIINNYDCIVFDEAHHCGATVWGEKVLELKQLVLDTSGKQMIGATATGTRYLDNYLDVALKYFDGMVVSRLPVSTAILNNLLPAPFYINTLVGLKEKVIALKQKLLRVPYTKETRSFFEEIKKYDEEIEAIDVVKNILKKYNVKPGEKYIVFCKDIEDLKLKMELSKDWFDDFNQVEIYLAHSKQKKEINKEQIRKFGETNPNKIKLMFAVDIFNEGFHIDNLDGVLMFRKTKSPIIYFQQIGRTLSFSSRKSQVKIFDFVNNLAESDVVYSLYKSIIEEAKEKINVDSEKKELYTEILTRLKIVDYTSELLDRLNEIEKYIDHKYIVKNYISDAINKLKEYVSKNPYVDFFSEMQAKNVPYEYLKAYNYLRDNDDFLTIEDIEILNSLNIDFNGIVELDVDKRILKLKGCTTFYELNRKSLNDFIINYAKFYRENNRRPNKSNDADENDLYISYRNYLSTLSKKDLRFLLNSLSIELTFEENVLVGNYPSKEKIDLYIKTINKKLLLGENLDLIEIKVLRKIREAIPISNRQIYELLDSNKDIGLIIDDAINTIYSYKTDETNLEKYKKSIRILIKNAKKISTAQYEKMLKLGIFIPKSIAMPIEERKKILGEYQSFYEKDCAEHLNLIDKYIQYVKTYKSRPTDETLIVEYENALKSTTTSKIRKLCRILKESGIELSFYEKVIAGYELTNEELESFSKKILDKVKNDERISKRGIKILNAVVKYQRNIGKYLSDSVIKDIAHISKLYDCIDKIKRGDIEDSYKQMFIIRENYLFITKKMLLELEQLGINISSALKEKIASLKYGNNIFEEQNIINNSNVTRLCEYIERTKKTPAIDSDLYALYENILINLSGDILSKIFHIIRTNKIKLSVTEEIIFGCKNCDLHNYLNTINKDVESGRVLTSLEIKALSILDKYGYLISYPTLKKISKYKHNIEKTELVMRVINDIRKKIELDPRKRINYGAETISISLSDKKNLEAYRINLLAKDVFDKILKMINKEKKSIDRLEDLEIIDQFYKLQNSEMLDDENRFLLNTILRVNNNIKIKEESIEKDKILHEYYEFIIRNFGRRPNLLSLDESEKKLALNFEKIKLSLNNKELAMIKKSIVDSSKNIDNFYNSFIEFIEKNGRFPCGNSDDNYEVMLNDMYVLMYGKLSIDRKKEIANLKRKYSKATIIASLNFKDKMGGEKNGTKNKR